MKKIIVEKGSPLFLCEAPVTEIIFNKNDYLSRISLLTQRMASLGLEHVAIYGDREHFSNIEYFCSYDCRFEEALFVVGADGSVSIIVGNEGISQTYPIPYDIKVYLYQNFSLQGQPRGRTKRLSEIFKAIGVKKDGKIGLAVFKYFESGDAAPEPFADFDAPAYILGEVLAACDNVMNFTRELTGLPDGLRMSVRTAKEIAWIENAGNIVANVVIRMLKALKPGLTELELSEAGRARMHPLNVHPMINFGAEHVRTGVRSPNDRVIELGEVCTLCYSCRGNLTSRAGVASYDAKSVRPELAPYLDFYSQHWYAIAKWLETVRVGAGCGELYDCVMDIIGGPEFGVVLNPTHYSGTEEWSNSPMYKDSPLNVGDGAHIQVDIISSKTDPVMTAICEDCVVIAGHALRESLRNEYPEVFERVVCRQKVIREVLGINIHDDVLPMSNLNFVYHPYMLDLNHVFVLR